MSNFEERLNKITKKNKKTTHTVNTRWPMEKKVEVVGQWLILGNLRIVAATCGVPYDNVRRWRGEPWWSEVEAELRTSQNIEMDVKLTKIVEKSLDATLDRVENGEVVYNQKTGEMMRKPAALRDVHRVAADLLQRREVLRDGVNNRNENPKATMEEQLKIIATQFAQWFEPKKQKLPMLGDVTDAVSKEWEEGLQEGTPVGENDPPSESEGTSGEEQGSED